MIALACRLLAGTSQQTFVDEEEDTIEDEVDVDPTLELTAAPDRANCML